MELAGRSRVLVLVGILFTIGLAGVDGTVVGTVMPVAIRELGGSGLYAWAFAAYMLATAVSMPVWGPGSDRWGRKRTFLVGVAVFVAGSALCAAAPTMPVFIAARALQGIGAGAVTSLPFIVLGVVFPPEKRAKALGIAASAWAVSSVGGPLLGTAIVANASWRWVFLVNVPIGALATALVLSAMPESFGHRAGRFDILGSAFAGLGGSALIWAFVDFGEGSVGALEWTLVAAGLALLAAFVWHEGRAEHPILPLAFFRHRGYATAMAISFLTSFSAFGVSAVLPLRTSEVFGAPAAVGLVVGSFTIGWSGAALVSGRLVHRWGERVFALVGLIVHAAGLLALATVFDRGLYAVAGGAALAGVGMGLLNPGITVTVQNSVEVQRMGSATTSQQFTRQVGAALGVGSFVLAANVGGFGVGIGLMVAVTAAALLCAFGLPRTSLGSRAGSPSGVAPEP